MDLKKSLVVTIPETKQASGVSSTEDENSAAAALAKAAADAAAKAAVEEAVAGAVVDIKVIVQNSTLKP